MLPARLQSLQQQIYTHRRWLSNFLQRSSTALFSTTIQRQPARDRNDAALRRSIVSAQPTRAFADRKLKIRRTTNRYEPKRRPRVEQPADAPPPNPIIEDIRRKASGDGNVAHVIENYNALNDSDKASLERRDVRQIAQCLHHSVRKEKTSAANQQRQSAVPGLVEFAEALVKDIKDQKIVPMGKAHLHLIGIFKESGSLDKGLQFWNWLQEQDDSYVDVDCYAAAIELLAVSGTPLAELERLYEEALSRFPGNFAAYHLSPEAILPDREQPFMIGGIPITLLQGILTARLLNGDTRNAYLALDTVMRILPDQVPPRVFWIFAQERPLQEAYTVFALACRGGSTVPATYYRSMIGAIRSHASTATPEQHALAVRAILSITHMFIGNGGRVAGNTVNELVIALTQFLRVKGIDALSAKDRQKICNALMDVIREVFAVFGRYGAKPSMPAFNTIITNVGGFGGSKQTISIALKDADALGLAPTEVTWRSILSVAGMFKDRALVEKTWVHVRDSAIEQEQNPRDVDFHALVKPAHLSGAVEFAREELEKFRHVLGSRAADIIAARLDDPGEATPHLASSSEPVDLDAMLTEIGKVKADIELIKERTEGAPAVQDFSQQALPMTLMSLKSELDLPESALRKIYDELTSMAPGQQAPVTPPPAVTSTEPAKSKTNLAFGTLRFENWKMVNYLLEDSERNDRVYNQQVDEAIAAGKVPRKRTEGLVPEGEKAVSWGLSGAEIAKSKGGDADREVGEEELGRVRESILRLRGRK